MKRITATALAILLVLNLCVSAFALTLSPTVDKNSVAAGEDVTVTLSLDEAISDVTSLKAKLYFDQDTFAFKSGTSEVSGVTVNQTVQTEKDSGKPYIVVNYIEMSGKGSVPAGSYATVTFTASKAIKDVSNAAFSALIASSLMVDGSSSANTKEVSVSVTVNPASTEVKGYAVAASAENSSITVNEEARVALKISNKDVETTYNAYYMKVSYDAAKLTYMSVTPADATIIKDETNGTLKIAGYGDNKTCGTDNIVLTFTGKATGEAKVTVISAKVDASANAAENDAPDAKITTDAATITVGGYQVSLPDGFTGDSMVANHGQNYTFTATDTSKKYDFAGSTMGGKPVEVTDNGNGTYTISNVTGELDIKATALVKINLDNQAGAVIDGITNGKYVKPNTAINFTVTPDADKELEVTVNGEKITGVNRQGTNMYSYTIAADKVTGPALNIVVNYKTDTITIIETGGAWGAVTLRGTWNEGGGVIDMSTAGDTYLLKLNPTKENKKISDYVVTINNTPMEPKRQGPNYAFSFIPAEVVVDGKITIDVSYKKTEPAITVDVSEYLKLDNQSIFLITATCDELTESKVLAYGEKQMYWSEKYNNNNGAYAWLVIADGTKSLDALTAEAKTVIAAVDGTKAEIVYNGDVNQTTRVDINDAQLVWNMYNAQYSNFDTVNIRKFLEADMNGNKTLDTSDAAAIVNMIMGSN